MKTIRTERTPDGLCILTFDRPDSSANVFDSGTLEELDSEIRQLENVPDLRGLVLISAKPSIFVAGADLRTMSSLPQDGLRDIIMLGQNTFQRIADLPVPTVAAIHGACMGGGYEVALACDWRVATDDRATKIGLPETRLGILPGWGGCKWLPALTGAATAYNVILGGKTFPARGAKKRRMIDMIAHRELLLDAARKLVARGKRRAGGDASVKVRLLAPVVRRKALQETRGQYPAVLEALEVIASGGDNSRVTNAVVKLAETEAARNLIRVFFLQERAKRLGGKATSKIDRAVVVGAGVMGAGIAQWLSARGLRVLLKDIDPDAIGRGMQSIGRLYRNAVKRRILTHTEARNGMDRISPAVTEVPMERAGIVIEAAVEKLEPKKRIFAALDAPNAILATNTSALPLSEIATATNDPGRVVGLHFFNPVHRMQLVEVVRAKQTRDDVLQRAVHFAQQIGKLPVIVKDSPGFLINRILAPYLVEAGTLFEKGASARNIDDAMRDFGMPMGPLRLLDEVGIDIAEDVVRTLAAAFPDRIQAPAILSQMAQNGWLGKKSGRGFYRHGRAGSHPSRQAESLRAGDTASGMARREMKRRLVLLLVNESARCLEESVVEEAGDVDFGMIMGTGFAPFRGGPLRFADTFGIARLVAEMESRGGLFSPCDLLRHMARNRKTFYED